MSKPVRIQLSRKKGWKMPENTVKVDRSTRWGNPFKLIHDSQRAAMVGHFRQWVTRQHPTVGGFADLVRGEPPKVSEIITRLRGKNLACWCRLDQPCHADVLLELANRPICEAAE